MLQYTEELEPRYRHAAIDLFVDPARHGRGVGTRALALAVAILVGARPSPHDHRSGARQPAAVRCYAKAGFRVVGITARATSATPRASGWHDGLLMEFLATPVDREELEASRVREGGRGPS